MEKKSAVEAIFATNERFEFFANEFFPKMVKHGFLQTFS